MENILKTNEINLAKQIGTENTAGQGGTKNIAEQDNTESAAEQNDVETLIERSDNKKLTENGDTESLANKGDIENLAEKSDLQSADNQAISEKSSEKDLVKSSEKDLVKKAEKLKTKTEQMYATMNPWRLFFVVAAPGMVSMFAMSIYSIIEGIFIGQILGEGAFAAVNIAMPLVMINFSLADLIGVGASAPISIALGKKDHKTANNVFSCSVVMIFIVSIIMGTIMFFAAVPLSKLMGASDVLLDTAVRYLRAAAICSPLAAIFFAMDNYLRISGFVKMSMVINIGCNILTMALLAFFLLVLKMDVVGSSLATSLAMSVCSIIAMLPFIAKKALLKFTKPQFNLSVFKQITACGSPVFLNNISGRVTSIIMNISLMTLGAKAFGENGGQTAVAVYAVLMYSSDLCWPLLYGISDSLSPSLGYNWGAKNYNRVKKIVKTSYIGTAVVGLISTSILFFFPDVIASWFVKAENVRLLEISTHAIKLFCLAYLFRWIGVTTQGFFTAIEKPLQATLLSVGTAFIFPVILLGSLWSFGLDGIWFNFVGVNICTGIFSIILFVLLMKKINKSERLNLVINDLKIDKVS